MKIDAVSSTISRDTTAPVPLEHRSLSAHGAPRSPHVSPQDRALSHAAHEMEAVFVRHLLAAAKIGGSESSGSGYGSMAVDALAAGIETGGGIGLARRIEEALAPPRPHAPPARSSPVSLPSPSPSRSSPVSSPLPSPLPSPSPLPVSSPSPLPTAAKPSI